MVFSAQLRPRRPLAAFRYVRTRHNARVLPEDADVAWWTTSDVATYLGVRVATVSTYRARGQMPAPDLTVGRTHMWKPERIMEWHKQRPRPGVGGRQRPKDESAD